MRYWEYGEERSLSLPCGRGVGDPSPQAPPFRAGCRFFPKRKFYSIFFKKLRFPKAVRQRKFGFQPKLPGRKRPSSGVFSDLRSEARHSPRRPLSLPCGRGVGDPSPQAPPFQAGCRFFPKRKFYSIFSKKSRFPKAVRQRKFGFQPKLPGRKRPSSGVFSGFQPEARFARRPLSLPYGRGVGDPSPQAPPFRAGCRFFPKRKFYSIFSKKIAVSKGRAFGRSSQ